MPSTPSVQAVTKFLLPRHCRRQFSAETLSCMFRRLPRLEEIAFETWDLSDIHYGFSHGYRYAQHLLAAPDSFRNVKSMTVFQDRNKYFNAVSRLHKEELPRSHQANVVTPPVIPSRQPVLAWEFATASLYLEHLSIAFIIDAVDFFDQCREKWLWCELRSLTLTSQLLTCNDDSFKISGLLQTAAQMATHMPKLERLTIWNGGVNEACAFTYRKHQHNASVACATDMTLFGYDQGVFSGVVVTQDFLKLDNLVGPTKTNVLATVTAIYDIGCFVGAVITFTIGERLGRKKAIIIGTVIMSIGIVVKVTSYSLPQMTVGRVVLGIGNGINTATAPIWQTETAQAKWRGKLVILEMAMNIAGFCLVNWINYGLSFVEGSVAWRFPLAFQFVFIFVLFATVPWLPESPRWLIAHGRTQEATEILACIEDKPTTSPVVTAQLHEIQYSVDYELQHAVKWKDILLRRNKDTADTKTLRRLLLSANTQLMQQFGGINIMSYYMPTVLINSVGLSERMARLLSACNAVS
ncbi:hypothetical protein FOCG_11125 [Fusarium oxysporum f. sp. radicis-lycopersici 26381]|uniref:Major facilitator superfamily (MFS) profile domain-containing protein n=1 Tax=Fusarium oxysporum Fo47 TaxID=660027 RepID=W9KWG2_FUSOX|nr:hypothetical protein FOZG_03081 [Fusarium oxysporum Fo47]EXL46782.1 hypothetical protein FOCG_11125 [Fusarium oxysporum f. sp. radicis-lycopersici 26381]